MSPVGSTGDYRAADLDRTIAFFKGLTMNRKSVSYIAISACCIASAGLHAGAPKPFNGPYAGGQLGTQMAYANQTLSNNVKFSVDTGCD